MEQTEHILIWQDIGDKNECAASYTIPISNNPSGKEKRTFQELEEVYNRIHLGRKKKQN